MRVIPILVVLGTALTPLQGAVAQDGGNFEPQAAAAEPRLSAEQVFALAAQAAAEGDLAFAESAYQALTNDPDLELRTEARFRLAKLYADRLDRPRDAAALLRRILDDKPEEPSIRIELARVQALMGNYAAAERELRSVSAGELPAEVIQMVRFYANALASGKPSGGSIAVALAPSSNINRATTRTTLDTVIGDFTLNEDARARSGVGLSLRGQAYRRIPLSASTRILARVSGDADIYRQGDFSDLAIAGQVGPEWRWGRDQFALAAAVSHRWFGYSPYILNYGLTATWRHPLSARAQLRIDGSGTREINRVNRLQTGGRYGLSAALDTALSRTSGAGVSLYGNRFEARDPGYATTSVGTGIYYYREFGRTTAVVDAGYSHLAADKRLFLYPEERRDDRLAASISGTFRSLSIGTFAPLLKLRWERNFSTINIYDFKRLAGEVGIVSAF